MKRTERDWFAEPERPRGGEPTAVPVKRWEDSDSPPRAALLLAWAAVLAWTVLGLAAIVGVLLW